MITETAETTDCHRCHGTGSGVYNALSPVDLRGLRRDRDCRTSPGPDGPDGRQETAIMSTADAAARSVAGPGHPHPAREIIPCAFCHGRGV